MDSRAERSIALGAWRAVPRAADALGGRWSVRPVSVLRFAILLLFVANLGRIPLFSTGDREAPLLVNDLAVAAVIAAGALVALDRRALRLDRVALTALLFAVIGGGSALWSVARFGLSPFQLLVSLAYLARWLFYFGLYVVVTRVVREPDVEGVWRTMETTLLLIGAFGIFQSIFLPGFAQMVYPDSRAYVDWDPQGHRLVSTVLEPNIVGAMLLIGLLVQLARIAVGVPVARWKPLVMFTALVLTLSRGSVVGLVAGLFVILAARGLSKRLMRLAIAVAVILVAAAPALIAFAARYDKFTLGGSAATRLIGWGIAIRVFLSSPIFGVGFNTYGFVTARFGQTARGASAFSTDGGLLFVAVMTGVVGLAVFLFMLWLIFRRCRALWRTSSLPPAYRGIAIGTAASLLAVCVQSTFANSLFTPFVMELLWVLSGLTFAVAAAEARRSAGESA